MKRFSALALALCLAFGGTALADKGIETWGNDAYDDTRVNFTISTTYTIVIPSQVSLNSDKSVSSATIEAKNVRLRKNVKLVVTLGDKAEGVGLQGGEQDDTVAYKIYKDSAATNELTNGSEACSFQKNGSSSVYFKLTGTPRYAGTYYDIISFRVNLVDESPVEVQ